MTSGTLTIVQGNVTDDLAGGELDVTNPTNMTLTIAAWPTSDLTSDDNDQNVYDLLHLILNAFHSSALLGFDAWEEGMARAAAAVAIMQVRPNYSLMDENSTYMLWAYDYLNQPGLANATFFPTQDIPLMAWWRVGMAMSAWLKIFAEYPNYFVNFNAAYDAQILAGNTALSGNLSALEGLLSGVAPTVESLPCTSWYNRQYVLQPTSMVGQRLFVFPIASTDNVSLQIYYFYTNPDGSETSLSGQANLDYETFDQVPLYPEEGNQVSISATGEFPGIGFINPTFMNIGGTQSVSITTSIAGLQNTVYFPYNTRGTNGDDSPDNTFFGVTTGASSGTLQITVSGSALSATTIAQGAFAQSIPSAGGSYDLSGFTPVQFQYTSADGTTNVTMQRDVGPGVYEALLPVSNQASVTLTNTFLSGTQLVAFPLTPTATGGVIDPRVVLGLPTNTVLQFAWWNPAQQKYLQYPDANLPTIAPGLAFWLNLPNNQTATITGTQLTLGDPRNIVLQPGWNMVGNTYNAVLYPWDMTVSSGSVAYSLAQAMVQGLVGPLWTYNPNGSYEVDNSVAAWGGGWMFNSTTTPITLSQGSASRMRTRSAANQALTVPGRTDGRSRCAPPP